MINYPLNMELITVSIYLLFTLGLGIISGRKVKSFKEYALGTRNLPTIVMGMTVSATLIGGGSSLGTSTEVFKYGIIVILAKFGVSIGALLTAFLLCHEWKDFQENLQLVK